GLPNLWTLSDCERARGDTAFARASRAGRPLGDGTGLRAALADCPALLRARPGRRRRRRRRRAARPLPGVRTGVELRRLQEWARLGTGDRVVRVSYATSLSAAATRAGARAALRARVVARARRHSGGAGERERALGRGA